MNKIIIDDDFLFENEIKEIEQQFYSLPTIYSKFTVHAEENNLPKSTDTYSNRFMYCSYENERNFTNSLALNILEKFSKKNNIEYDIVSRTRSNITFFCNEKRPSIPHIDNNNNHMVLLYYVNNSDGDTVLYKNKYNKEEDNKMIVDVQIAPKAGRAVLFDGSIYHSFYYPTINETRSVININISMIGDKNV